MVNAGFALLVILAAGTVLVGSLAPARWLGDETASLTVESTAEWHSVPPRWTLTQPEVSERESRIIELGSYVRNTFSLVGDTLGLLDPLKSSKREVVFTLEAPGGGVIDSVTQKTCRGSVFGCEKTLRVVFQNVPPGQYVVRATLTPEEGSPVVVARQVELVAQGAK